MANENDSIPMKNSALAAIANKRVAQENGTKTIEPPIKRSQTTDPDTGAITYRQSWSNTTVNKSSTPASKTTPQNSRTAGKSQSISSVGSKVPAKSMSSKTVTPGSREITSAPVPKSAGRTDNEIKAPLMKESTPTRTPVKSGTQLREEFKQKVYEKQRKGGETREEFDTKNKIEQKRVNENAKKAKEPKGSGGVFMKDEKYNDASCRTC